MFFLIAAVVAAAYGGTVLALVDLARRHLDPWQRIAWVTIILAFPFVGMLAYATVGGGAIALNQWRRAVGGILVAAAALHFFSYVHDLLIPFAIAFFLAALLDPLVAKLQRQGASRMGAVASIYLFVFLALVLLGVLIVPRAAVQVSDLGRNMTDYSQNLAAYSQRLGQRLDRFYDQRRESLTAIGLSEKPSAFLSNRTGPVAQGVRRALLTVQGAVVGMLGQVLWFIIIPLSLFYFLLDYQRIRTKLISLVPEEYRQQVDRVSADVVEIFSAYLRSLAIVCFCYGATASILFTILRLKYSLFLGIGAGVLYAVPYVGPAIAIISAATVALVASGASVGYAALVVALFVVMHFAFDYGVTPRVVGGSVGLHPLVNIFALMCGATLFGVWGMLLAVPVAASIQMLLLYFFPKLGRMPPEERRALQQAEAPPEEATAPG